MTGKTLLWIMVCGVTQFSGILPDDLNLGLHWNHITVHVYCTCLSLQIPLHVIQNLHSKAFIIRSLILIKHSNLYLLAMRVVHKSLHNKNVLTIQIIDWRNLSLLLTKGRGREVGGEPRDVKKNMWLNLHFRLHQMDLVLSVIFFETNNSLGQRFVCCGSILSLV